MKVDYLIAEIGSTTTVVTAFNIKEQEVEVIGQGKYYTTIIQGDVNIGLIKAIEEIEDELKEKIEYGKMLATSSAAGGLKITVHGLVQDMTVKAAKETALGAGGIIRLVTAGKLTSKDIEKIKEIKPNLVMIAGGTDGGERETALYNAQLLSEEKLELPFIYCGNTANSEEVKELFKDQEIYMVPNVYPRVDELNIEPARKVIQKAFENNIVKAPGMSKIKELVDGAVMPTPGAVMESTKLLYELLGDIITLDVGGATTDVHSVTEGNPLIQEISVYPEPKAKRTVEGDLGVYINMENLIELLETRDLNGKSKEFIRNNIKAIPISEEEIECSYILTKKAVEIAINRHVGSIKRVYGVNTKFVAYGKDLSIIKYIIGTGGALVKLPAGDGILKTIRYLKDDMSMYPKKDAIVLLDNMYIMACAGVLSLENKEAAIMLLKKSLNLN